MRRVIPWAAGVVAVAVAGALVAVLLGPARPAPRGPEPGRSLFRSHCATCHGADGRGASWRAWLLFLRPGNLAAPEQATLSGSYLADLIRHGGATLGMPGMPSFGAVLSEEEIHALVSYLRILAVPPRSSPP